MGKHVRHTCVGEKGNTFESGYVRPTFKWFIFVFDHLLVLHVQIVLHYLAIIFSFDPLLNGNGLATSHAPGYASPEGTVTLLVKRSPAKEIHAKLVQCNIFNRTGLKTLRINQSFCRATVEIVIYNNTYFHFLCEKRISGYCFNFIQSNEYWLKQNLLKDWITLLQLPTNHSWKWKKTTKKWLKKYVWTCLDFNLLLTRIPSSHGY